MEKQEKEKEKISIQNLLNQVNLISKHYDRISSLTGEKFNIFSIMSMERNEVYTHSAIISELLNTNGSHGQGDVFLDLFINEINKRFENDENKIPYLRNSISYKESTIKDYIPNEPSGGRIDIYVTNNSQSIIIENKIDAESQPDQLLRYYNYAIKRYKDNFWLFYLQKTKNQHTVEDLNYSCGINDNRNNSKETKQKIIKITYEDEILNWLNECLKYTANLPIIRETINQYIYLLNKITNKTNNKAMATDIIDIIAGNPEYVKAIETLYETIGKNEYHDLKIKLVTNLIKRLEQKAMQNGLIFIQNCNVWEKESAFTIYKEKWKYGICVEFADNNLNTLDIGVRLVDDSNFIKHDEFIYNNIREIFGYKNKPSNIYWLGWEHFQEWDNIPWYEFANDTATNKVFEKIIGMIQTIESNPTVQL